MDYKAKLLAALGLGSDVDDAAIDAAISAGSVSLQSQNLLEHPTVLALQAENASLATGLKTLQDGMAKDKAVAFVDGAIAAGHVGVKPAREEYISLHMSDPAKAEKMIGALPKISGTTITETPPNEDGSRALDATDRQVIALFGVDEESYKAGLASGGVKKETL